MEAIDFNFSLPNEDGSRRFDFSNASANLKVKFLHLFCWIVLNYDGYAKTEWTQKKTDELQNFIEGLGPKIRTEWPLNKAISKIRQLQKFPSLEVKFLDFFDEVNTEKNNNFIKSKGFKFGNCFYEDDTNSIPYEEELYLAVSPLMFFKKEDGSFGTLGVQRGCSFDEKYRLEKEAEISPPKKREQETEKPTNPSDTDKDNTNPNSDTSDTDYSDTSNPNSSKTPEPTSEQLNDTQNKLNQAQESDNEEDIARTLKETSETIKNSGDENLKKQKEEVERKLSKDKLRVIIREEVNKELAENGIEPEQLSPPVKQKFDELNNNNNNDQTTRAEIFSEIGKQKLLSLINGLEQALKSSKKVLERKVKELQAFISSKIDYKQQAYKLQKNKVEELLVQAQNWLNQNDEIKNKEGFLCLNNPLLWVFGVVVIGLVVGVVLVERKRTKKKKSLTLNE